MTVRISLKAIAFVVYTLALLGGAFGISYAVFEWRHDDEAFDASAIEKKIDELEQADAEPTKAELDAQRCGAALEAAGNVQPTQTFSITRINIPQEIRSAIDRYCK